MQSIAEKHEEGRVWVNAKLQGLGEYALVIGLIVLVALVSYVLLRAGVASDFFLPGNPI